jgi:hypothetical protein
MPNNEVERREVAPATNGADLSRSLTPLLGSTKTTPADRSNRLLDDSSRSEPTLGQIRWLTPFCVERLFYANKRVVFRDGSIQCVRFRNMTHRVGKRDAPHSWIVVMSDQ